MPEIRDGVHLWLHAFVQCRRSIVSLLSVDLGRARKAAQQ
jgi:hypothetical protein